MDKDREFTLRSIASKSLDAIKRGRVEIQEAVSILTESHHLALCQVWIPRTVKNENEECGVKLGCYYAAAFKDYYDACVKIQDGSGGLALKALETYQTYFSRNIYKGELHALLPATAAESSCCLAICMRNIYTGDFDYVFEFFFSLYLDNPRAFFESLFLKLESCLSSFKFSSGAQLGRQLLVLDADNLTASFKILALKKQEEEDCNGRLLQRSIKIKFGNFLKRATVEIQEALLILTKSHGLTLCQVWIHHYAKNKNEKCAIKLDGYCAAGFKDYYDACVKIQDGVGGLAMKTLVTYQTYFSRNIINGELHTSSESSCCCLAICLRNIYTVDLDYAFEFFFSLYEKDSFVFLESLLLTLKGCFPNFKLSLGAQLGHQLRILDGDNLGASFDFLAFIKQEEEDDCKEDVKQQQFGTPSSTKLNTNVRGLSSDKGKGMLDG